MVTVMKPNGKVHIGLQKPNENVKRERFKMPTTEETLAKRTGAIVFSWKPRSKWFLANTITQRDAKHNATAQWWQLETCCILFGVWGMWTFPKVGIDTCSLITGRKPPISLIDKEDLDAVPIRCQRLLLRLVRFGATAEYAPGKTLVVADTLSRSPLCREQSTTDVTGHDETLWLTAYPVQRLINQGCPEHSKSIPATVLDYYPMKDALSVITEALRLLDSVHVSHEGLNAEKEQKPQCGGQVYHRRYQKQSTVMQVLLWDTQNTTERDTQSDPHSQSDQAAYRHRLVWV